MDRTRYFGCYTPMATVFVLQHAYEWCGRDEVKMIGVYATHAEAKAAVERLRHQSGFRDWPDGFSIDEYELGLDHWIEGFATAVSILIPCRDDSTSFQVAGSIWRPGDLYKITNVVAPENAVFRVGDLVRCVEQQVPGHRGLALVAVSHANERA